jgi:hypothetical protein
MPDTFQAAAVAGLGLLPGALYTWAFEREAGAWGVRFTDRALRFVGTSAIFHVLFAPLSYWLWLEFVPTGRLRSGDVPMWAWALPALYVAVPTTCGVLVGRATRARRPWARLSTGPNPAPRAWDHLIGHGPDGWVRLRLKSGVWLAGAFATMEDGRRSYAAGYPDEPDLYLVDTVDVDPGTGEFSTDEQGRPLSRGSGILVRWSEIEYLEFIEA